MIDLFRESEKDDIANNADDTTPYSCGTDIPLSFLNYRLSQQKFLIGLVIII